MAKYMSQMPPEPKPKPRKIKPQPAKGPRKPSPKMDNDLRNIREMPKRNPRAIVPKPAKGIAKGIMGSTEVQAQARQQKALDDMRKRMMLRPKKELKNN
jgi:hypothetical protein